MEDHRDYRLTAYLFDSLSAEGRREVEAHLAGCARCREELADLRKTLGLVKTALPAGEEAAGALEKTRMARVLDARRRARVRTNWFVGITSAAAAILVVGGLVFLFATAHRAGRAPASRVRDLAAGYRYDDEAPPAAPIEAIGVITNGPAVRDGRVAGRFEANGLDPGSDRLSVDAPAGEDRAAPARPPAVVTAAAGESASLAGDRAPAGNLNGYAGVSGRRAEQRRQRESLVEEAPAAEQPAQVADDAGEVPGLVRLHGVEKERSELKREGRVSSGVNDAIGIGGGAAGAYGQRWGKGTVAGSGIVQSGEKRAGAEPASRAIEGDAWGREVNGRSEVVADIPLGTSLESLSNAQLAKEDNGLVRLPDSPEPKEPKAPPPYDPTVKRDMKRLAAPEKSLTAGDLAPVAKPETRTPEQRLKVVEDYRLAAPGDEETAKFKRGDDSSTKLMLGKVDSVKLADVDADGPVGLFFDGARKSHAKDQPPPADGAARWVEAQAARENKPVKKRLESVQFADVNETGGSPLSLDLAARVMDGNRNGDIQGWSFGVRADKLDGVSFSVSFDDPLLTEFHDFEPIDRDAGAPTLQDTTIASGKPAAASGLFRIGAEPVLRAYSYYRTLDANLDLGSFTARLVPVPPPSADGEGLTQEEFRARHGTNPFVDTRVDHFSTFGMDVDTASYTRARDALRAGKLPEPKSVRVEEFVNYFPEEYRADPETAFSVFCEGGPSPFGRGFELLKIAVKARELRPNERKNAVLTFAVDVSGSMAAPASGGGEVGTGPTRLALVAHALGTLVDALGADDRVGIVAYSTHPALILPHTPVRERRRLLGAIESLAPAGATNIEAGLDLAYRVADEVFDAKALNRVILCSDGVANLGARGPEEILKKATVFARRGIYLSAVGFGQGKYNDAMLGQLADKGNGNYRHVDSPAEAARVFNEDLPKTLDVLAQDAKIQVDFNPDVVSNYRLLGYEKRDIKDEDFRNDKVDAGEVGPGTTVTVLYEIKRRTNPQGDIGKIYLRYRDTGTGRIEETNYPLSAGVLAVSLRDTTDRFRFITAAAETAELLRESYFARDGSFERVAALLARASPEFKARPEWVELNELVSRAWRLSVERLASLASTL